MSNGNILATFGVTGITVVNGLIHFTIRLPVPGTATEVGLNESNFMRFSSSISPLCDIRYVVDPASIEGSELFVLGAPGNSVTQFTQQDLVDGSVRYRPGAAYDWFDFHIEDKGRKVATGRCLSVPA